MVLSNTNVWVRALSSPSLMGGIRYHLLSVSRFSPLSPLPFLPLSFSHLRHKAVMVPGYSSHRHIGRVNSGGGVVGNWVFTVARFPIEPTRAVKICLNMFSF